jgi:predicted ATPase/DNA-binding SARP family transcriptional activator
MTAKPDLRILLLGSPAIFANDEPLQIQRRLLRWLLFFLACQKEMVGRADLILLFWPDEAKEDARRHLREMLSKLRAQLPDHDLILTEQDRVGLDFQRVSSDVLDFQSLSAQTARACAQTSASTPLTQAVYQKVVQAVRLWRSARFLAGATLPNSEGLNDWLLSFSQQMETQRQRLLERLADHAIASGDSDSAIQRLRQALEGDETNETLHYRLLNLLHKQGRYSEALNYCTYLQELFRREGYNELPPSLLSLSRKIQEGASQPAADSEGPTWPALADMQVPFVGQQTLLQELQFAVRRGSPVILFGEAGSGKSRLVRELFFSLKPVPRLLLAPARKMENHLPFQPIIDLLRHDILAEEWQRIDLTWATPLSLLLPELAIMRPEIRPLHVSSSQEHSLIFEALNQLFRFLGKKRRFLLFLDNAQWSDETTLSALAYLAERGLFGENGALVLAARHEEITPPLDNFLNRPRSTFSVQRLALAPLNADETGLLASYVLGDSSYVLGDSFLPSIVSRLERETGGNPLFLLETLRLVLDYSFSSQLVTMEYLPLASSVHALIRERLQQLSPAGAQVVSVAAVIGSEFSVDLLENTCMLPAEQVVQSLEGLAQSNLIKAALRDRPSGSYTFAHEKIREVVLLELSAARKRLLHLRIARALEQKHQGQSPDAENVLASHYEEAGELSTAFQHWLEAALYAWRNHRKDEAIAAYHRAEDILQRLDHQASDFSIYQLYRQWGRLAFDLSDAEMMEQGYNRLLQFGQLRQNPLLAGSAYNGLAQVAELRMQPDAGLAYLENAAPFLEQAGRLFEYIEAQNRRGMFMLQTARYTDAQAAFQRALALGEQANDAQSIEARVLTERFLAVLLTVTGWPMLALEMTRRSLKDAEETFQHISAIHALSMQAVTNYYLGRLSESLAVALSGLARAEAKPFPHLTGDLRGSVALASFGLGDLDTCWENAQHALQINEQNPVIFLREAMQCLLGQLYSFLGAYEEAAQIHRQGSQSGYQNFHALDNHIHLASALLASGDFQGAQRVLDQVIPYTQRKELMLFDLNAQLVHAALLIDTGQYDAALPVLDLIRSEAQRRGLSEMEARSSLIEAKSLLRQDCPELAAQVAGQAVETARKIGHLPVEIDGCALWLEAAQTGGLEEQQAISNRLEACIQALHRHVQIPELKKLLEKRQKAWTKSQRNA